MLVSPLVVVLALVTTGPLIVAVVVVASSVVGIVTMPALHRSQIFGFGPKSGQGE